MDHPPVVRIVQPGGDLPEDAGRLLKRQSSPAQEALERYPLDKLHDDIEKARSHPVLDGRNDVGMIQGRHRPGLMLETRPDIGMGSHLRGEHLDGHRTLQGELCRHIHNPHRPPPQLFFNFVSRNLEINDHL